MASRKSSKYTIPIPGATGEFIVGVLEQVAPDEPTRGRKIALILHGTMGHKDYLFQKRLALKLPMDSFRFDFRGNHESSGIWKQAAFERDLEDLQVAVDYLAKNFGYEVDLVVGHSKGSLMAMKWLCSTEEGKRCSGFVNASGRYRMRRIYERAGGKERDESFRTLGYYDLRATVARKPVVGRIYPQDMQEFASWDTSIVWDQFPPTTHVLTIHGLSDTIVPPYDAMIYASAFSSRSEGSHNLHYVEDGDHNFTGRQDEVVECILEWWHQHQRGALKTGVWTAGARGKL